MLKVQEIRELIKLIDDSSIEEFTYESDGTKVAMKKSLENVETTTTTKQKVQETKKELPKAEDHKEEESTKKEEQEKVEKPISTEASYDFEIKSPMVGTFYRAPNPESDPYVKVGDSVDNESIVCIVEAMKLFNEIEAETTGKIVEILVEDGELVEYGQPLFKVKTK